ncbi:MAG: PKD domain-containing protein, partial [Thermoplasmatota archaeon]
MFSAIVTPMALSKPGTLTPQPIYGYAEYSSGGNADGAYVEVTSALGTVDTYVGPAGGWGSGYWQVDVGDPGPSWPDGTNFTVIITNDTGWESNPETGVVTTPGNNMGTITLYPSSLNVTAAANPTNVGVGNPVDFTSSVTGGVSPYSWSWDFGDGTTSTLQNPTHTYQQTGMFTAMVNVTDNN